MELSRYCWRILRVALGSCARHRQSTEGRLPGLGTWRIGKPRSDPEQIHRRSRHEMMQMGFGETDIPRATEVTDPDALRDGSFNARTRGVRFLKLVGGLALPGGLERFVLFARAYR